MASISHVRDELNNGDPGHLREWSSTLPNSFWLEPDGPTASSLTALAEWVTSPERVYKQSAKEEFLRIADFFLVAQAHAGHHQVVTREQPAPGAKKRVPIPDACLAMDVPFRSPFDVYRTLNLRFN